MSQKRAAAQQAAIGNAARVRIRVFSLFVWVLGLIAIVVLVAVAVPGFARHAIHGDLGSLFGPGAQEQGEPRPKDIRSTASQITWDGPLTGGTQGGYVVLPGGSQVFELTMLTSDPVRLYQQQGADPRAEGAVFSRSSATTVSPSIIVGDAEPSLLWMMPTTQEWSAELRQIRPVVPVDRIARGEAPTAVAMPREPGEVQLEYRGEGNFVVKVVQFGRTQLVANVIDEVRQRVSWRGEGPSVLWIEYASGPWTATFDENVPPPTPQGELPTPSATPLPSATTTTGSASLRAVTDRGDA